MKLYDQLQGIYDKGWMHEVHEHILHRFNFEECMDVLLFEDLEVVEFTKDLLTDNFSRKELGEMFWEWCEGTRYKGCVLVEPGFIKCLKIDPSKCELLFYYLKADKNQTQAMVLKFLDPHLATRVFYWWLSPLN